MKQTEATADQHDDEHHELPFWRKYIYSTDHKMIGYQYLFTSLFFLFFGFTLMMIMRWSLAYPNQIIPVIGGLLPATLVNPQFAADGKTVLG